MKFSIEVAFVKGVQTFELRATSEPNDGTDGRYKRLLVRAWSKYAPGIRYVQIVVDEFIDALEIAKTLEHKLHEGLKIDIPQQDRQNQEDQ